MLASTIAESIAVTGLHSIVRKVIGKTHPVGPVYGGDAGGTKFSSLSAITRDNVGALAPAWEWRPEEAPLEEFGTRPGNFQNTPLMRSVSPSFDYAQDTPSNVEGAACP